MSVRAVVAPYDAGHRGIRVGAGPEHLVHNGLISSLRGLGLAVETRHVELDDDVRHEVASAFELDRLISEEVRSCVSDGAFPLVLSGNCNSGIGTLSGMGRGGEPGVVWLDGHADLHTPETTTSGFTDCMGVSIAVGHCWEGMAGLVPGYSPVLERFS